MKDLQGKTAVVTGAGSGIGEGTVHALADAGMNVVVADINGDSAERVAADLRAKGVGAIAATCDVSDQAAVAKLADAAYGEFGSVEVLHNNAGICFFAPVESTTAEQWRLTLDVNLNGVVNGIQVFLPRMRSQGGEAHIVNTASLAGILAGPMLGAYNASKFAVLGLTETMRHELAPHGIGVSVLCPGGVATNIMGNSLAMAGQEARQAQGRTGAVESMASDDFRIIDPMTVGRMVRRGIERNDLYVFTHPEFKRPVQRRYERMEEAFDDAAARDAEGV